MRERASEQVSDCMSLCMWCSSSQLQILLTLQSHLYTRRKRPNKNVHIYTYLIRCMLSLLLAGAACYVCLLRVKMLIAATFVLLSYTFNMLFRCKRHRVFAKCCFSLSNTRTQYFSVLVILYTAPNDGPQYKLLVCCC